MSLEAGKQQISILFGTSSPSALPVPHTRLQWPWKSTEKDLSMSIALDYVLWKMWFHKRQERMQKHLKVNIKMSEVSWLPPATWTDGFLCCVPNCFSTPPLCPSLFFGCSAPLGRWSGVWLHSGWKSSDTKDNCSLHPHFLQFHSLVLPHVVTR